MLTFSVTVATATLLAAAIAAAAALLSLAFSALATRGTEGRAAHRAILEPHLVELGIAIHEVVSGAVILHRRAKEGKPPGESGQNAARGADVLKRKRLEIKYVLDGLAEPLRVLSRGYDWIATYKGHESGDAFLEGLQDLSRHIDATIARSYRRGRPPRWWERRGLQTRAEKLRAVWDRRFATDSTADADDLTT